MEFYPQYVYETLLIKFSARRRFGSLNSARISGVHKFRRFRLIPSSDHVQ